MVTPFFASPRPGFGTSPLLTTERGRLRPISTSASFFFRVGHFDFGQFLDVGLSREKEGEDKKRKENSLGGAFNKVRVCVKALPAEGRQGRKARVSGFQGSGFRVLGFRVLGFWVLGFRV